MRESSPQIWGQLMALTALRFEGYSPHAVSRHRIPGGEV